ncbi:hypothetical protein [Halosimplex halobium]|uniref:hypothetical protein n=1 Tax=Halosimplex halobium TaxID=3396618 RepID=UPI003F55D6A0
MGVTKKRKKEFLEAIVRNGDRANVTEIRLETGFSRNQIDYWFPRLAKDGLIEKRYDGRNRRVAVLTDSGRTAIEQGEFGKELLETEDQGNDEIILSKSEFQNLTERIETLENKYQAQREQLRNLRQKQNHLLEIVGLLRMWIKVFQQILADHFNVLEIMETVEREAMDKDDLDASFAVYKNERYEN